MKFSPRTVTVLWDVHTWVGILAGLVVAAMFFAGSISLFHHDIEAWQDPPTAKAEIAALDTALAAVDAATLIGKEVGAVPPSDHAVRPALYLPGGRELVVDPATGKAQGVRSRVGQLFFHLHFMWHQAFPAGMVIAGLFGVLMLLAVVTGVVIHLKDLRRQAFRFRPWLRPRYLWSDLHKVLGVWGLPFQIMIAFTGALICVAVVLIPPIAGAAFDGDRGRGQKELYGSPAPAATAAVTPAATLPFVELARRASAALPGLEPTYLSIDRYGQSGARATIYGDLEGTGFHPSAIVTLDASSGAVLSRSSDTATPSMKTMSVVYGIHFATYGGLGLRLLYFVLGLAGWLTILSGNWIWIERRAARRPGLGTTVLGRLTLGLGGGIVIAAAAVLWLNRLTPPSAGRPAIEVWGFFAVWAAVGAIALVLPLHRRSWAVLLAIAAAGFLVVPLLSVWMSPAHLGNGGGLLGWRVLGIDVGIGAMGLVLAVSARTAWRRGREIAPAGSGDTAPASSEGDLP